MFTPFRLRGMTVANRVVVAPMDMYSADEGLPGNFHLVHLGARALGGAGLVMTEMVCVAADARISPGCAGLYRPEHVTAWRRIVDFVHEHSGTKIALQLGHAGRKGSTQLPWEGGSDAPLPLGNWPTIGPSPIRYAPTLPEPREMTRADMDRVRAEFVSATVMGVEAGFDMIELHAAHGYLLSSFITPLSNRRQGRVTAVRLENRLRYPLEVFAAMRRAWPADRPMSVRISATDWVEDGVTGPEAVEIARAFHRAGADIIHVSTGQTSMEAQPVYGRMYQTPFSDEIRNEAGVPTIAVGNITEADQVNGIIAAGRADLCALARAASGRSGLDAARPPRPLATRRSDGRRSTSQASGNSSARGREPRAPYERRGPRNPARQTRGRHRRRPWDRRGDRDGACRRRRGGHADGPHREGPRTARDQPPLSNEITRRPVRRVEQRLRHARIRRSGDRDGGRCRFS